MYWLRFWGFKYPPFHTLPLSFRDETQFRANFVHTRVVHELDETLRDMAASNKGGPHLLVGGYGSGKSTLLNYIAVTLKENPSAVKPFFPIYAGLPIPSSITHPKQCDDMLNVDIIQTLRRAKESMPKLKNLRKFPLQNLERTLSDPDHASSLVEELIQDIHKHYRIVFLFDEIDKVGITDEALGEQIALAYFSGAQRKNEELWDLGDVTVWTAHVGWEILDHPSLSYLSNRLILEKWTMTQINDLLDMRCRWASEDRGRHVSSIFDSNALESLYLDGGVSYPRDALRIATIALKHATGNKKKPVTEECVKEAIAAGRRRLSRSRVLDEINMITRSNHSHRVVLTTVMDILMENQRRKSLLASAFLRDGKYIVCDRQDPWTASLVGEYDGNYEKLVSELEYLGSKGLFTVVDEKGHASTYHLTRSAFDFLDVIHRTVSTYTPMIEKNEGETADEYNARKRNLDTVALVEALEHLAWTEDVVEISEAKIRCPTCGTGLILESAIQVWYCPNCRAGPPRRID